jgi:hypothetical protein
MTVWPTMAEAEQEALQQEAMCICWSLSQAKQPCGSCRAARMIRALVRQVRERAKISGGVSEKLDE